MTRRTGLGKGLDALIPREERTAPSASGAVEVAIDQIIPNPRQPRLQMDPNDLAELADSIREHGIIQPLIVRTEPGTPQYILVAGERRLRAAGLVGLQSVPVVVRQATSDQEQLELALIENVQRADLTPLETAEAYRHLTEEFGLSQDEVARRVGKSRVSVTNTLRLLNLAPQVQQALNEGRISEGHARALLGLTMPQAQEAALETVLKLQLTVRQTEELVRKLVGERPARTPRPSAPAEIRDLEERLRHQLGAPVSLRHGTKGGTLTIRYYSDEELNAIIAQLLNE